MTRLNLKNKSIVLLVILVSGAIYGYTNKKLESEKDEYRTRTVDRGDIVQIISANGTVHPLELVNVGTQVSGTVSKIYVDFNDQVKIGQILAELDPALLKAQLQQSEANFKSAQSTLKNVTNKATRSRILLQKGFISSEALDEIEQQLDIAHAQVAISKANVERDRANLNYSVIRSPISGVVVARDINVGQTVAASFQTPILFQIARDLRQMQINISVAEADIGQIYADQEISFTVDAFREREFIAHVKQIRLNPIIQENVVTYNVVATVINDDSTLLPGMTANVRFIVNQKCTALRVPNAALRYKPRNEMPASNLSSAGRSRQPLLYRLENNVPTPINVVTGITDGNFTEIISGDLAEGDKVIINDAAGKKQNESSMSNFRFRMF
ncbi:efflux RND transporter periplasmic adaptor subunit [Nitrosomonas sp. Is37]|uniref:efflux RND transporter periplasmic adaptor subunit n=1 Tax=Nitrosomonas sp. Is37 TaxID=3080535 RepID=UPI00294B71F1|nr:efflux RND transporter periplasmic adaptor subunit [Nitrosomonas sp. Is37]MDV6343622.1 efflux RND transporter periplasmic adaptor subunit [Nitrosomonas sp. Is37]